MSNQSLPGNPFATDVVTEYAQGSQTGEQAITAAFLALAHEQRTANLQRQLKWDCGEEKPGQLEAEAHIRTRLGLDEVQA